MTIGKFDGIHLGHKKLLSQVRNYAERKGILSVAMVIEKRNTSRRTRIFPLRDKLQQLAQYVDIALLVSFNEIKNITPQNFVALLIDQLKCQYLAVGGDFRFGSQRKGDVALLQNLQQSGGYRVDIVPEVYLRGKSVRSSAIRQYIAQDDLHKINQMLGHSYYLTGRVAKGNQLGSTLGFPTANLQIARDVILMRGVYAVWANYEGKKFAAVANIGTRPTVVETGLAKLEVHIFDFKKTIYGKILTVQFVQKIRNEMRFDSKKELLNAIRSDSQFARQVLQK